MSDLDLPDVNVLVALVHPGHVHHRASRDWFGSVTSFATTPITESGLLRLAMNPAVMGSVISANQAMATLQSIRRHERATFLADDSSLVEPSIALHGLAGHRQVTDLHLINLAARHSARLVTFDAKLSAVLTPEDRLFVRVLG